MDFRNVESREKLYSEALAVFGVPDRIAKTVEELCELSAALCRYVSHTEGHDSADVRDGLLEELADADIMLEQAKYLFDDLKTGTGLGLYEIRQKKLDHLAAMVEKRREALRRDE